MDTVWDKKWVVHVCFTQTMLECRSILICSKHWWAYFNLMNKPLLHVAFLRFTKLSNSPLRSCKKKKKKKSNASNIHTSLHVHVCAQFVSWTSYQCDNVYDLFEMLKCEWLQTLVCLFKIPWRHAPSDLLLFSEY